MNESGQHRDVEVNTTTGNIANHSSGGNSGSNTTMTVSGQESMLVRAGEDAVTVRRLRNINYSRVLNFVFRQMLQEYIVLTFLHDASIVFSTGYPGHKRVVRLSQLQDLLETVIPDPAHREEGLLQLAVLAAVVAAPALAGARVARRRQAAVRRPVAGGPPPLRARHSLR